MNVPVPAGAAVAPPTIRRCYACDVPVRFVRVGVDDHRNGWYTHDGQRHTLQACTRWASARTPAAASCRCDQA